jgi:hypothetical protein
LVKAELIPEQRFGIVFATILYFGVVNCVMIYAFADCNYNNSRHGDRVPEAENE